MENQFDKKLLSAIRNRLKAHSEPYEAGAWEAFLERKKKRRRAVMFWYAAAVMLLLLVSTFILINGPFQVGGMPEKQQITTNQIEDESQQPAHLYSSSADSLVKIPEQIYVSREPGLKQNSLDFNSNSTPKAPQTAKAPETITNNPPAADSSGNGNNTPLTIARDNRPSSVKNRRPLSHKEAQLPVTEINQTTIAEKDPSIIPEKDLSGIKKKQHPGANEKEQPLATKNNRSGADATGPGPETGQTPDLATAQPAKQGPAADSTQQKYDQEGLLAGKGYANKSDSVTNKDSSIANEEVPGVDQKNSHVDAENQYAKDESGFADEENLFNNEDSGLMNETVAYENTKKGKAQQPLLALGFGLASGYGETEEAASGTNGVIREAGVIADLKFSRRLTLASGLFFASQTIESEEDLPIELTGELSSTRSATTTLANLSMPVNLKYTLPNRKENLFISAGIANFVRFGTESETVRTIKREITVIRELNGIEMLTTEIETVTSQSTNEDNRTTFIPAGMLNIAAGLSGRLSDQLQLEVSPYYKYPLRDWSGQDARFGIIGLDLRLLFQKKKQP